MQWILRGCLILALTACGSSADDGDTGSSSASSTGAASGGTTDGGGTTGNAGNGCASICDYIAQCSDEGEQGNKCVTQCQAEVEKAALAKNCLDTNENCEQFMDCIAKAIGEDSNNGCTPDCAGKDCGSNGCGGSCGSCASTNKQCTEAVCSPQQTCTVVKKSDAPVCEGMWFTQCYEGEFQALNCFDSCKEVSGNFVTGCGIAGASNKQCNCYTVEEKCTKTYQECGAGNITTGCLPDDGMFYQATCEGICAQTGMAKSLGCKQGWGCMCATQGADGKLCLPKDEPCGVKGVNESCCAGFGCTCSGQNCYCKVKKVCAKECIHFDTGICCGGALCAGKCVGNPCCN